MYKKNKNNEAVFENKKDVTDWLKHLLRHHPLTTAKCYKADFSGEPIEVFTDEVIRKRYTKMIKWLESDEVA